MANGVDNAKRPVATKEAVKVLGLFFSFLIINGLRIVLGVEVVVVFGWGRGHLFSVLLVLVWKVFNLVVVLQEAIRRTD